MSNQIAVFIDFENVALWAEQEFLDFELTPLMEFLQSRGPVVLTRVYGDWSRFFRYRDDLMNNAVDLVQIYSVRAGENRADIRLALDALETAINRDQIKTFVIVSGDSDFGPLVQKFREYGRYTLGIGPRDVTHPLLIKACDEFVYLEAVLGDYLAEHELHETTVRSDSELGRSLMDKALRVHMQRGELPVLAAKLKQTMLQMDPAFNEANFGYTQFKSWLETNHDALNLYFKEMQLFVAPKDYIPNAEWQARQAGVRPNGNGHGGLGDGLSLSGLGGVGGDLALLKPSLRQQYMQIFNRLK